MKPIKTIKRGNQTFFVYEKDRFKSFIEDGLKYGDVGFYLHKQDEKTKTYKMFGTIESPSKHITTVTAVNMPDIWYAMPPQSSPTSTISFRIIDFSK